MINYPAPKKKEFELRLGSNSKVPLNGGLCLDEETSISLSQSPYGGLKNICYDDGGMPIKRWGQAYVYPTSLGSGGINGIYPNYKGNTIIAWGDKLYTQSGTNQPVQIYSGLANSKAFFFVFNGILYMLNGTNYIQYNGTSVTIVTPYIPRVKYNCKPDGTGGTADESWNLIGTGFATEFSGDGTSTVYVLPYTNLDSTTVTATVDGVAKTEGTHFTVDRTNGKVTFTSAPSNAGTLNPNNVRIVAYKTFSGKANLIFNCTKAIEFSNRIFVTGNNNQPNFYYAGGITPSIDASYFPEKYSYSIHGNDKAVTGFMVHYNQLIVFKEDLTATVEATTGLDNTSSFPISYLNTEIGCDMPDTIQLINNSVVFCNTYAGVHIIVSTVVPGEKNILCVSQNINGTPERPGLLQENITDLKNASSVDHNFKYYVCAKNRCYVWDYKQSFKYNNPYSLTWLYYTNVNARCFAILNNVLIYGDRDNGLLIKFVNVANDFGNPIEAIWKTKLFDFGYSDYEKSISDIWLTTRANSNSSLSINYYFDKDNGNQSGSVIVPQSNTKSFDWDNFDWDNFTWDVQNFSPTVNMKPRLRGIRYFQIELINNIYNENLSIISLVIKWALGKRVK